MFIKNNQHLILNNNYFNYTWILSSLNKINNQKQIKNLINNLQNKTKLNNFSSFNKNQKKSFFKKTWILNSNSNSKPQNFYDILGVDRKSTNDQIKQAYLKLAKQYHPDVNKDKGSSDEKFKSISLAYEALYNPKNRELYDASMGNDHVDNWNSWKDEEEFAKQDNNNNKAKARSDKYAGGFYRSSYESNFWKGEREEFEQKFYKDYENIFGAGWKESKHQKGEDILVKNSN